MPGMPFKIGPQKDTYPGDTVKVQDPPTSNGAATDAFDEGKGIKAPPGARGEYLERPPGNYGGPGGSIGVDPSKFDVNETNRRRRDAIPPMYLPAVASASQLTPELVDGWERVHDQLNVVHETGEIAEAERLIEFAWKYFGIVKRAAGRPVRNMVEETIQSLEQYLVSNPWNRRTVEQFVNRADVLISELHDFAARVVNLTKSEWYTELDQRRQSIRMILRAAKEIDDEDEPRDSEEWKGQHDFERQFFPEEGPVHNEGGVAPVRPVEPNLPAGQPEAQPHAAPLSLDRLNNPDESVRATIYGVTGSVTPGLDTTQNLKFYNLDPLIQNPQITEDMLSDLGYKVETFSYNPERFKLPKLKMQGYDKGTVWIYDPAEEHGSFKDSEYTRAWRVFHEVGHGITEDFMQSKYGPSRREGRLGVPSTSMRGVPPKQVQVEVRPLSLAEAQRAVEWEDVAFRAQQMLLQMYGVGITPQDFAKEYNVNIADALYRVMTGDFGDPGEYGYVPSEQPANLRAMLEMLQQQEQEIARETGREPTVGVNLAAWQPVSDQEIRGAIEQRMQSKGIRRAFSVFPVPKSRPVLDQRLLLQIPHAAQERYNDLNRRVHDYVRNIKMNTLDMFEFPADPPADWVEEEKGNVPIDWQDHDAWSSYMGRLSHDDVADWIGLEVLDDARISELAPKLHAQHLLETGGQIPFAQWFRSAKPAVQDQAFLNHVKDASETFPTEGLGKGYSGYWRRRNHEMVKEVATSRAKERHDRFLREVAYRDYVRPHLKESLEAVEKAQREHTPVSDLLPHLNQLPVENRDEIDGFQSEWGDILDEGMHSLDLYREPVSGEDRQYGDMSYMGERWVDIRRIEGAAVVDGIEFPESHEIGMRVPKGGSSCAKCVFVSEDGKQCGEKHFIKWNKSKDLPAPADEYCCDFYTDKKEASRGVSLYKYGSRYFFVTDEDTRRADYSMGLIRAHVYDIAPGSSQVKKAGFDWERKSKALAGAIREIQGGANREATFHKYGREYGPGLRKAVSDYFYVTRLNKESDGGGGGSGSTIGDSTCSSFANQSPDNCDGCTFNVGTGGPEFGYGDGACTLTHLFLNAPNRGFGRGDQTPYSDTHQPGKIKKTTPVKPN